MSDNEINSANLFPLSSEAARKGLLVATPKLTVRFVNRLDGPGEPATGRLFIFAELNEGHHQLERTLGHKPILWDDIGR